MKIIALRSGERAKVDEIGTGLADMQAFVEGYIEAVTLEMGGHRRIILWCNEEGRFTHAPNRVLPGNRGPIVIHGPCFICAARGDGETVGLTDDEASGWLQVASGWLMREAS